MSARENIADILCIGQQRAMTSWLHHVVAAHPRAWAFPASEPLTSTAKEAHFWDWNHQRGARWYRSLLRPDDDTKKSLDFTPDYAALTSEQIDECKRLNPTATVVMILRDPLARALSSLRMHSLWAKLDPDTPIRFDAALEKRIVGSRCLQLSDAAPQIDRWQRAYPDMHIIKYEDLRQNPAAIVLPLMESSGLTGADTDAALREALERRMAKRIWETPPYRFDRDVLHFLNGATRTMREQLAEIGLTFTEGPQLMETAS